MAAGGGLDYVDGVLDHVELDTDSAELAFEGLVEFLGFGGGGVGRVGVECLEHGDDCLFDHGVGVDFLDIVVFDDGCGEAQFLVGAHFACLCEGDEAGCGGDEEV